MARIGTNKREQTTVVHVGPDSHVPESLREHLEGEESGFKVVSARNTQDALARIDAGDVDCLVSEYELPETTGLELLDSVRAEDEQLPFLLFTGSGTEAVASRAISAGVTDYIRKDTQEGGIEDVVRRVRELADDGQGPAVTDTEYDEDQFQRFLQAFPDAVFVIDEDGQYLDVINAGDQSLLYDNVEELVGSAFHELLPTETADMFLDTVRETIETGEQQRIEYQLDVQGGHRWFEARVGPMETHSERETVFWTARDITERKQREREYEQIFNSVNDAITVFDPETGEIVDVNDSYYEVLGYEDLDTIRELGIEGLSASDDGFTGERGQELIEEVNRTGEPKTVDWRGETRDGETLWLEATLAPAVIGGQERVLSIQRDVTERRELEQTYRDIFENVSDGLVVHDPETGEILAANERYCELTGYEREELLDSTIRPIMPEDPEYTYEGVLTKIEKAREEGPQLFEFKGERKDGTVFVSEVHLRTIEIRGNERVLASVRDITERKRRKQEYEQIFNNVNEIIAVRDAQSGELLDVNQSYADLLGYERAEMRGMKISDVGVPEEGYDDDRGMAYLREVMESDGTVEFEWKVEGDDGRTHLMEVRGTAAEINGQRRYLAIGREITERKRRERAIETLQDATDRLQTATTPEDVAMIAVETASDVLDLPMAMCWFHDDETDRLDPVAATPSVHDAGLVSDLSPERYEYDVFADGSVTEYTPSEQASDNPLETGVLLPLGEYGLIAAGTIDDARADETVLDIAKALADHVTTALDRVEQEQAVRESERRFRMIAERIDEVIYLAEPDFSEVLYVNPAYEEIWGRSVNDLEDNPKAFIEAADQRDRDDLESGVDSMVEEIRAGDPDDSYDFEYRIRQPDGEVRWVHGTGYAVELSGEQHRFVGIVEDITERKHREQRLEVFNRILRHNLRNQLDVIRSHAEFLADRTTGDHAERIMASVDELAAIGAEARETDRIMSMGEQLTDVQISETVSQVVDTVEPESGDVRVTTEIRETTAQLTNEDAVAVAVESALENAIEHAQSSITVAVETESDGCVIVIEDDGPGIPDTQLTPIETGKETNLQHGRGLGLWQLRWCVDKLNGELSFDTSSGTTVRITIPDQRE
jgi:PAS domain S-box-containing protein